LTRHKIGTPCNDFVLVASRDQVLYDPTRRRRGVLASHNEMNHVGGAVDASPQIDCEIETDERVSRRERNQGVIGPAGVASHFRPPWQKCRETLAP
jgi:hypothetical protein